MAMETWSTLWIFSGLHGTFWLLSTVLLTIIPFIYFYVPEAKDIDLENIDMFFAPAETTFYMDFPLKESKVPSYSESCQRIQMIENCFGTSGNTINDGKRVLLAEGLLTKHSDGKRVRRHFFLFNDLLVWGSVIKENINYIRQKIVPLDSLEFENISNTNTWTIKTPGKWLYL